MRPRISNLLWGLFFVILGVGFAGNAFGYWHFTLFFAGWWTLFIIIPCLISIIQDGPGTGNVAGILIGVLLLLTRQNILSGAFIAKMIVPIILIIVGLSIMFSNSFHRRRDPGRPEPKHMNFQTGEGARNYSATFSGQNINFDNQVYEGGSADAVFGSVTLHLEQAIINEDIVINVNATFGGIEIYLPYDINVRVSCTPVFGGVSNKRRNNISNPNAPTVFVNATCMFGGVDIK